MSISPENLLNISPPKSWKFAFWPKTFFPTTFESTGFLKRFKNLITLEEIRVKKAAKTFVCFQKGSFSFRWKCFQGKKGLGLGYEGVRI